MVLSGFISTLVPDSVQFHARLKELPLSILATRELENPQETAERVGLAALIIQVCEDCFPGEPFIWYEDKSQR